MKDVWVNTLLLVAIVVMTWMIFTLEPQHHSTLHTDAILERRTGTEGEPTSAPPDWTIDRETEYRHLGRTVLFETLIPTPTPVPVVATPPPQVPPLREALANRWKFNVALGVTATFTDQQGATFNMEVGTTQDIQFGQFTYTVKLAAIDDASFSAFLEVVEVKVASDVLSLPSPLPDQYKVQYSLLYPNLNP